MDIPHAEKPASKQAKIPKLTREQIKEGLEQVPIDHLLGIKGKDTQLTHKQREFAKAVAIGNSKAEAYRQSHKAEATQATLSREPYVLAKDPRIANEIEAYKMAMEASKYRNPIQLREHLIHQLVQHSINPETPPAQQIKALELIGKLYEVGAFMERKETTVIHQSSSIKEKLIERLRAVIDVTPKTDEGLELLEELKDGKAHFVDPTAPAPTPERDATPEIPTHTIPLKQSDPFSEDIPSDQFWKNVSESEK
jgi:hypothetical protein